MCGIFAIKYCDTNISDENVTFDTQQYSKCSRRGPENSTYKKVADNVYFGFHRLAINGLTAWGNQPMMFDNNVLICNGEIYNHSYLGMNVAPFIRNTITGSDCETILHLYEYHGIEKTLSMLDGVFAFVIYDKKGNMIVARDPYGVRPLYQCSVTLPNKQKIVVFASELKCLSEYDKLCNTSNTIQFPPGTYKIIPPECNDSDAIPYHRYPTFVRTYDINYCYENNFIMKRLQEAVVKRCKNTERPVACLLSGGLDSSVVAALVAKYFRRKQMSIETFSIGIQGSPDLHYAKIVSEWIGSIHTEYIVSEEDMFNAINEVIVAIESYDVTTVRASIGNYLIGKYISQHSEAKVIFNGDGSDELFGGYKYMDHCPDDMEFDAETKRLLKDIHLFDVLRSDKCISSNGLEPRTPFLDRTLVDEVLSICPSIRNTNKVEEKKLLRDLIGLYDYLLLPQCILRRKKEAFSDGVTSENRSLYVILQEKILKDYKFTEDEIELYKTMPGVSISAFAEEQYYKKIFKMHFPNNMNIVPYKWMPKYVSAVDPSARTI